MGRLEENALKPHLASNKSSVKHDHRFDLPVPPLLERGWGEVRMLQDNYSYF
jgi:hypothetical protein